MSAAIQDCKNWLGKSFQAFRMKALEGPAAGIPSHTAEPMAGSLLDALCAGDLVQAEALMKASPETSMDDEVASLGLMLPVISQLEQDWRSKRRTYVDTVFAFWNVRRLLNNIESNRTSHVPSSDPSVGRALLAASPGTQHIIGLSVVDDSFRLAGWSTQTFTSGDRDTVIEAAKVTCADVIGLSVGQDEGLINLDAYVSQLRSNSRNRSVKIILGGNVFSHPVRQYSWLGADYIAPTIEDALGYCSSIVSTGMQRN